MLAIQERRTSLRWFGTRISSLCRHVKGIRISRKSGQIFIL